MRISSQGGSAGYIGGTGTVGQLSLKGLGRYEDCEFSSLDGVTLRGTYVHRHTSQRHGVVVFCHEFGGDRHTAASYVLPLLDRGFDVFAFDFRNHGTSDRMAGYMPRTWATRYEVNDVLGAVNYLRTLDDADMAGVALIGLSRGGCAAISAASRHNGIWAVITDGAFESRWVTTAYIRRFMPRFVRLASMLTVVPWFLQVLYGTFVHDLVARKLKHPCIKLKNDIRRVRQPFLMIHGARDHTIPVELAHRLWRRLRTPRPPLDCAQEQPQPIDSLRAGAVSAADLPISQEACSPQGFAGFPRRVRRIASNNPRRRQIARNAIGLAGVRVNCAVTVMMSRMSLTPLEEYFLCEDRQAYPWSFFVRLDFVGDVHRETAEKSLSNCVGRHPLLSSVVRCEDGRLVWQPVDKAMPIVQLDDRANRDGLSAGCAFGCQGGDRRPSSLRGWAGKHTADFPIPSRLVRCAWGPCIHW